MQTSYIIQGKNAYFYHSLGCRLNLSASLLTVTCGLCLVEPLPTKQPPLSAPWEKWGKRKSMKYVKGKVWSLPVFPSCHGTRKIRVKRRKGECVNKYFTPSTITADPDSQMCLKTCPWFYPCVFVNMCIICMFDKFGYQYILVHTAHLETQMQ